MSLFYLFDLWTYQEIKLIWSINYIQLNYDQQLNEDWNLSYIGADGAF